MKSRFVQLKSKCSFFKTKGIPFVLSVFILFVVTPLRSQSTLFTARSTTPTLTLDQQKIVNYYTNAEHKGALIYLDIGRGAINDPSLQMQFIIPGVNNSQNIVVTISEVLFSDQDNYSIRAIGQLGTIDLYITPDGLGGTFDMTTKLFDIVPLSTSLGILVERNLDSTNKTYCANEFSQLGSQGQDFCEGDCGSSVIDVLLLRTPEANTWLSNHFGGLSNWFLYMNGHNINLAFTNSLIPNRHIRVTPVNFNPSFQWSTAQFIDIRILDDLNSVSADVNANNLMIGMGADMVVLLTDNNYTGQLSDLNTGTIFGIANSLMPTSVNKFSIVQVANMDASRYTMAHEMSHHFGCHHSVDNTVQNCPHGTNMSNGRNTIMANNSPDFSRVPNFSNPDVSVSGVATGNTNFRNNAQQIRAAFCETANNAPDLFSVSFVPGFPKLCLEGQSLPTFTSTVIQGYCNPFPNYWPLTCGLPPYQYEWRISKKADFSISTVVATTANFTPTISLDYCPFFYLRLKVTSSNGFVKYYTKLFNTQNCLLCQTQIQPFVHDDVNDIFEAYPNPASNEVILSMGDIKGPCYLECYDLSGKKLILVNQFDEDQRRFVINTSSLEPGLYLFKVSSSGLPRIVKIVIQ